MYILGISAFYHDSAACLIRGDEIIAAAQEERFSRKKHDERFPVNAIKYCLSEANITLAEVSHVTFYEKPFTKFERLLETYLGYAPKGISSFVTAMPIWVKEKLFQRLIIDRELRKIDPDWSSENGKVLFTEHHQSHAASAFFPSPFENAIIVTADGVGEWATTSVAIGSGNEIKMVKEIHFPHSIGLLYSAFTYYTGFKVNSGEYKVMGLAPYGEPKYANLILDNLIDLREDGSYSMNMEYFNYCTGLRMVNSKFCELFGGPPRKPETSVTQKEMDLARSVQVVVEEAMLRLTKALHQEYAIDNMCLAGGVALNCVSNGRIVRESPMKSIWIQPAAGDAGGALGAALATWHQHAGKPRKAQPEEPRSSGDSMKGSFLGPRFSNFEVSAFIAKENLAATYYRDDKLYRLVAKELADEKVVGWFQGRMEFGPRALGGRSIIGHPGSPEMQSTMNLKIKYRESFRPFAPSILKEHCQKYFDLDCESPYMLLVAPVTEQRRIPMTEEQNKLWGIEKLNIPRSEIPAVTHVDYSARVQTVESQRNPRFYHLLNEFRKVTGLPVLVNTSFNVRGEPIVCTPSDAYRCFMRTEMDVLVIENYVFHKADQPKWHETKNWSIEFELD